MLRLLLILKDKSKIRKTPTFDLYSKQESGSLLWINFFYSSSFIRCLMVTEDVLSSKVVLVGIVPSGCWPGYSNPTEIGLKSLISMKYLMNRLRTRADQWTALLHGDKWFLNKICVIVKTPYIHFLLKILTSVGNWKHKKLLSFLTNWKISSSVKNV